MCAHLVSNRKIWLCLAQARQGDYTRFASKRHIYGHFYSTYGEQSKGLFNKLDIQVSMISSAVIIAGCPRSGTTLLYNLLSEVDDLWSLGYESKTIIEKYHPPSAKNWVSGTLTAADLTAASSTGMLTSFEQGAAPGTFWREINQLRGKLNHNPLWHKIKRRGRQATPGSSVGTALPQMGLDSVRRLVLLRNRLRARSNQAICFLEKTPENCLRLPFLEALFTDIRVIYLTRDGRANINSLMEGWRQPHLFPGYQVPQKVRIPGDTRGRWAFTLIPGWKQLLDHPLAEVCARQWIACNQAVLDHRAESAGRVPYLTVKYEDLITKPGEVLPILGEFLKLPSGWGSVKKGESLPLVNAVSTPDPEKWRRNPEIARVEPLMAEMMEQLGYAK